MVKLTPEQVCEVPELLEQGFTAHEIAELFEITVYGIRSVIRDKRWEKYKSPDETPGQVARCPDCGGLVKDDRKPCMPCDFRRRAKLKRELAKLENSS